MLNRITPTKLVSTVKSFLFCLVIFSALGLGYFMFSSQPQNPHHKIVAITQIIKHPSLDEIRQGIVDQLATEGFIVGQNIQIEFEDAQGNMALASQIAHKFMGLEPEVIVAISTPSAQAIHATFHDKQVPIVFSAVTDPIAANLVKSFDKPGEYITGTVDLPPLDKQVALLEQVVPHLKTLGVIYNPGEINAVQQIEKLEKITNAKGIKLVKSPAFKSTEVSSAARNLVGKVDAIYLPNDNIVISALDSIVGVTTQHKIPTLASEDQSIKHGVLMGLANNQYEVGRDTGAIVARILRGEKPGDIPVHLTDATRLTVNEEVAEEIGVDLSNVQLDRHVSLLPSS